MEFQVINRNRNAVIPEGIFKLCGIDVYKRQPQASASDLDARRLYYGAEAPSHR